MSIFEWQYYPPQQLEHTGAVEPRWDTLQGGDGYSMECPGGYPWVQSQSAAHRIPQEVVL